MFLIMGDEIILFNSLAKGRCRDKFLAMKHVCGLSDLQYDILVENGVQEESASQGLRLLINIMCPKGPWIGNMPMPGRRL